MIKYTRGELRSLCPNEFVRARTVPRGSMGGKQLKKTSVDGGESSALATPANFEPKSDKRIESNIQKPVESRQRMTKQQLFEQERMAFMKSRNQGLTPFHDETDDIMAGMLQEQQQRDNVVPQKKSLTKVNMESLFTKSMQVNQPNVNDAIISTAAQFSPSEKIKAVTESNWLSEVGIQASEPWMLSDGVSDFLNIASSFEHSSLPISLLLGDNVQQELVVGNSSHSAAVAGGRNRESSRLSALLGVGASAPHVQADEMAQRVQTDSTAETDKEVVKEVVWTQPHDCQAKSTSPLAAVGSVGSVGLSLDWSSPSGDKGESASAHVVWTDSIARLLANSLPLPPSPSSSSGPTTTESGQLQPAKDHTTVQGPAGAQSSGGVSGSVAGVTAGARKISVGMLFSQTRPVLPPPAHTEDATESDTNTQTVSMSDALAQAWSDPAVGQAVAVAVTGSSASINSSKTFDVMSKLGMFRQLGAAGDSQAQSAAGAGLSSSSSPQQQREDGVYMSASAFDDARVTSQTQTQSQGFSHRAANSHVTPTKRTTDLGQGPLGPGSGGGRSLMSAVSRMQLMKMKQLNNKQSSPAASPAPPTSTKQFDNYDKNYNNNNTNHKNIKASSTELITGDVDHQRQQHNHQPAATSASGARAAGAETGTPVMHRIALQSLFAAKTTATLIAIATDPLPVPVPVAATLIDGVGND